MGKSSIDEFLKDLTEKGGGIVIDARRLKAGFLWTRNIKKEKREREKEKTGAKCN